MQEGTDRQISVTVNDRAVRATVSPRTHLADFLREQVQLTGTHLGCEHGVCGACTVMLDGAPARGCIAFAAGCDGAEVRTIEGFGGDPLMRSLREAFSRHHALQCGYCTPGMLISAYDIVRRLPDADELRVREELAGNLCRCTGYAGIVGAVMAVLADPPDASGLRVPLAATPALSRLEGLPMAPAPVAARKPPAGATGTDGAYRIDLPVSAEALWTLLTDVEEVVRCLPGASLTGPADPQPFGFLMQVSLGPLKAGFEGTAEVHHDHAQRHARVQASAEDPRTRSAGQGSLHLTVDAEGDHACALRVALDYTLTGPLAQFSRGELVDGVVSQMLARFADNASRSVRGETVRDDAAVGGVGMGLAALWRRLRGWLGG
jgi:carbon-monoxide dehydrogenase small subunit